jgi:hypothetical protein
MSSFVSDRTATPLQMAAHRDDQARVPGAEVWADQMGSCREGSDTPEAFDGVRQQVPSVILMFCMVVLPKWLWFEARTCVAQLLTYGRIKLPA